VTGFDDFIAIDWSGARKARGIAVARCRDDAGRPEIVVPPDGRRVWSRSAVLSFLSGLARATSTRCLVGIDCAFSLPVDRSTEAIWADLDDGPALWARVDSVASQPDDDLYGGPFASDPRYSSAFWSHGRMTPGDGPARRVTERACADQGWGRPESPLKLIGAKQVGKGGLAGMRVLHHLRSEGKAAVSIWPFDDYGERARMVVAEIYPRLMLNLAGHGRTKVRHENDLIACFTAMGCRPGRGHAGAGRISASKPGELSDHETDALVAAAGLRRLWRQGKPLQIDGSGHGAAAVIRREGWIFGVSPSADAHKDAHKAASGR